MENFYSTAKFWIDIIQSAILAAVSITFFLSKDKAATVKSIDELQDSTNKQLAEHAVQIARSEESLKHHPTHDDLGKIHEKLNAMSKEQAEKLTEMSKGQAAINGELKHIGRAVEALRDNELQKGRNNGTH